MTILTIVFCCSVIFSAGLILIRTTFYELAENIMALLDAILIKEESLRQRQLVKNLGNALTSIIIFGNSILTVIIVSVLPAYGLIRPGIVNYMQLDLLSLPQAMAVMAGGTIPFTLVAFGKKHDYSEWSRLLHRMILNNQNISESLFNLEKQIFKRKIDHTADQEFVLVSGLARSGTTAMTMLLYSSGVFHSLSYANMPFLMSPNLWRIIYNPKQDELKNRSHKDGLKIGYNTVESFEEYFYKVSLKEHFIDEDFLYEHTLDETEYKYYLTYQDLIKRDNTTNSIYLAKNNNLLLRYESLRQHNNNFKAVFMFRDPEDHVASLLRQHVNFCESQRKDPFILEYMNWLGHHEFGLNQKRFNFDRGEQQVNFEKVDPNFWLVSWIEYYSRLLDFAPDPNVYLINYRNFLKRPERIVEFFNGILQRKVEVSRISKFSNPVKRVEGLDESLKRTALGIWQKLADLQELV